MDVVPRVSEWNGMMPLKFVRNNNKGWQQLESDLRKVGTMQVGHGNGKRIPTSSRRYLALENDLLSGTSAFFPST